MGARPHGGVQGAAAHRAGRVFAQDRHGQDPVARAAGTGARKIHRLLTRRTAALACCALLAWLSNWSVHAVMTLERPLGLVASICGSVPAPAPSGVCPVCEDSLAAGGGPVFLL